MHHKKCPYCGEVGYSLGSWDCGTRFAMGDEAERRSVRCCLRELSQVKGQRDEFKRYMDKLPTYCAYCGFEVPIDDKAASKIGVHIATCPKHPMRIVEAERDRLRDGLALAMEWLDEVCDPDCEDWTPEGLKVHARLTAILSATQSIEETKS